MNNIFITKIYLYFATLTYITPITKNIKLTLAGKNDGAIGMHSAALFRVRRWFQHVRRHLAFRININNNAD